MEFLDEDDKSLVKLLNVEENELVMNNGSEKKCVDEDCKSLLEQVNAEERQLRNKRRWLLGLSTFQDEEADGGGDEDDDHDDDDHNDYDDDYDYDDDGDEEGDENEDAKTSTAATKRRHPIPESLLREDDVSYAIIKSLVEKKVCDSQNKFHITEDEVQLVHSPRDVRGVLHLIKDMTNQGLDRFVEALKGDSVDFEKTRWKMTQTIKGHLLSSSLNKRQKLKLSENQFAVLKNPHNYRWSSECRFIPADSDSYRAAVYKILGALETLPTQTLFAMHRKIKGIKGYIPQLIPPKISGWRRDTLIQHLRKKSLKLLSKPKEGDSLQEPLAKAMDVAGLTMKLIQGCEFATNFVIQPSPETNALQNEIALCFKLLDERVELRVLKDIQQALNAAGEKIADRSLRTLVRNMLTEFLCECSDMEIVPECLRQVLAIIKKSRKSPLHRPEKMDIEEDVESILSVSASMKQLVWDLIPPSEDEKLDQEFADAYVEDLEDSYEDEEEDEDDDDEEEVNISSASTGKGEGHFSQRMHLMRHHLVRVKIPQQEGHPVTPDDQRRICKKNKYLAVQAATDEASMVAYRLIDHVLNDYAQMKEGSGQLDESCVGAEEGNSKRKKRKATRQDLEEEDGDDGSGSLVLLKAVEELLPSFAKKCEGLKKLKSR